jgi:hypothetical protein
MIRPPDQRVLEGMCALGPAMPSPELVADVVRAVTGDAAAEWLSVRAEPTGYRYDSISTGGLYRVSGTAGTVSGTVAWSVFVKVLQHPRHWALIDRIPPQAAQEMKAVFPWRDELTVREQVLPVLPEGLRVPDVYRVADLGGERLAVWMEDIDVDDAPWSLTEYADAARVLARLAARRGPGTAAGACGLAPGFAVRKLVESRTSEFAGLLDDHAVWSRPLVADVVDAGYRDDLRRATATVPRLLSEMDDLPSSLPHGDAAPVNLLRSVGDRGTIVAVDWAFTCQLPLGFDLGQLLVGEVERGRMQPELLPRLRDAVLPAYAEGLATEGLDVSVETVRRGMVTSLATRTLGGAFPLELTDGPVTDEHVAFLRRRAGLGRFVVEQLVG